MTLFVILITNGILIWIKSSNLLLAGTELIVENYS